MSYYYNYNYNPNYNVNCVSSARNCTSGCCTSAGYCASSLTNCVFKYYDFSYSTQYTLSNSFEILLLRYIGVWVPLLVYVLATFITILTCYCIRKKWVEAVNKFDTESSLLSAIINREAHIVPATSGVRPNHFATPHYV
jgi:hypothetical protein